MNIYFYTDYKRPLSKGDVTHKNMVLGNISFKQQSTCRESILSFFKKTTRMNNDYKFYMTVYTASDVTAVQLQDISDILGLNLTIYKVAANLALIAGECKDMVNFNYNLSALLFFAKYCSGLDRLFDIEFITKQLITTVRGRGVGERFLVQFSWLLAYTQGFTDFCMNVFDVRHYDVNGIATYSRHLFYKKYPELLEEFIHLGSSIKEVVEYAKGIDRQLLITV